MSVLIGTFHAAGTGIDFYGPYSFEVRLNALPGQVGTFAPIEVSGLVSGHSDFSENGPVHVTFGAPTSVSFSTTAGSGSFIFALPADGFHLVRSGRVPGQGQAPPASADLYATISDYQFTVASRLVSPEPGTVTLVAAGALVVGVAARRRRVSAP